ncbi:hypothetical protein PybrP1_010324 [[Pythium] brassicae (nom. inval.)]|nr:hypothetical protein PybrP1_010324 [[Pythium] brassicae (nom. inval.)]
MATNRPRVGVAPSSALPSYDRFQPKRGAPVDVSHLSIAQRLVLENKQRAAINQRRRSTTEVQKALASAPVEIGAQIWIPDPERVWRVVEVVQFDAHGKDGGMVLTVSGKFGQETLDLRDIGDVYKVNPRVVDDMTGLYYIHEAGILENLFARSKAENLRPYTLMANVLIAVNPLVRVVEPKVQDYIKTQMGERPPHPYAIAEHLAVKTKAALHLEPAQRFAYLNQSGCFTDPNVDDELLFDEVVSALSTVGIDAGLQKGLWKILAGLLHLGNIRLTDRETAEGDVGEVAADSAQYLASCAALLGVDSAALQRVITEREISTRDETFTIRRSAKEGGYVRDAIAKSVYNLLFKWIKWNAALHKVHGAHPHFLAPHEKDKKFVFIVKHFATRVPYTIGNFIDKNNDTIPKDLEDLIMSSQAQLVRDLFASKAEGGESLMGPTSSNSKLNKQSPVLPPAVIPMFNQYNDRTFTEAVLWSFRVDPDAYRLGRTKVFFKTGKIALLDALLKVDMKKMGPWIVARLRKWMARRRWRYALAKVLAQRAFLWLYEETKRRKAAILKMQAVMRMFAVRKHFIRFRNAHRNKMRRKALARKRLKAAVRAVVAANAFKALLQQVRLRRAAALATQSAAAVKIQALVRGMLGRKKADKRRQQLAEGVLRKRLQEEAAAAELARKKTAAKRWKSAYFALAAQRHFVTRLHHIRKARAAVEDAKRRAEEQRQLLLQMADEERERLLQSQRDEEERQRARAAKRIAAAIAIQRAFRRSVAREEAKRLAVLNRAQAASLAAAVAAEEAARAAEAASFAHQAEADAFRRLNALDESKKPAAYGTLGTAGALGAAGAVGSYSATQGTLGSVQPMPAVSGQAGEIGAVGSLGVPGALMGHESLQNADLSWAAHENVKLEGEAVAGVALSEEQLAQAGRDLFGEGGEVPQGPLMSADDDNLVNPVQKIQEFPTGPPIPYKGGILTCTMLGHRKQQDENWGDEYTEYVLRITWGRDILEQSKTAWLVGGRYNDFNALHQELKAAASGRRGKRAPWFPRFPKRHPFSSMIGKNKQEKFLIKREKEMNRYMTQVLTQMPDALLNVHMDRFLNLTLRTRDISEREAYAEARRRWEEEEREALANAAEAEPLNDADLQEVEQLVHQLLQKIIYAAGDVRQDTELQEMIHAVKVLAPRVAASAQIGGNVNVELIPLAMQLQDDIQDAFNQYHDTLLALRLGQDLN